MASYGAVDFYKGPEIDTQKFSGIPGVGQSEYVDTNDYAGMMGETTGTEAILSEISYNISSIAINTLETVELLRNMQPSASALRDSAIQGEDRDPIPGAGEDEEGRPNTFAGLADAADTDFGKLLLGAGLLLAITKFQDKLIPVLTKVLEGIRDTYNNSVEFLDYVKEDLKGAITGPGTVIAGLRAFNVDLVKTIKNSSFFRFIGSGFGLLDVKGGPPIAGGTKIGLLTRLLNIFRPLIDLGKIVAKLPVIATVLSVFGKGGTLLKSLGRLFYPLTILIGIFDTVKGFYRGFFGLDLEEGDTVPDTFLEKFVAGIKGGLTGLVNGLIGAPLDLLKNGIAFIIKKMGFDETAEAMKNFSFSDMFAAIIAIPFDFIQATLDWIQLTFTDPVAAIKQLWEGVVGEGGLIDIIYSPIDKAINFIMGIFSFDAPNTALTDEEGNFIGLRELGIKAVYALYDYVKSFFEFDFPSVGEMFQGAKSVLSNMLAAVLPPPDILTFEAPSVTLFGKKFGGGMISLNPIPDAIYRAAGINPDTGADLNIETAKTIEGTPDNSLQQTIEETSDPGLNGGANVLTNVDNSVKAKTDNTYVGPGNQAYGSDMNAWASMAHGGGAKNWGLAGI